MTLIPLYQNPARDGGVLGWSNCFCTCTAMQIAFETGNQKRPTGADVRFCCHNADGTRDVLGGTNAPENVAAAQRCWGVTLDYRYMAFEDFWRLSTRPDYALSVSISYAVISGTPFDGSPGFRGNHQVLRSGGLVYDPLADGRRAGIPSGPQAWPKALLLRAAGRYASVGEGRAAVVVARSPISQPKRYSVAFLPGAFFVYPTSGGRYRDAGFSKATSAPCSAPFTVPWGTGQKRLVTITTGRLAGKRVEPTATHLHLVEAK